MSEDFYHVEWHRLKSKNGFLKLECNSLADGAIANTEIVFCAHFASVFYLLFVYN
jgi:hypothetical protein